tara:strand:- start:715 stop:876 length:162 start_codon:yes stop_codon:yes gene_type:complete
MKATWLGPTGQNSELGSVHTGKEIQVTNEQFKRFTALGLLKQVESKTTIKQKG